MVKSLIRFLFFIVPETVFGCIGHIIFDDVEITDVTFEYRERKTEEYKLQKLLCNYLDECYKQVNDDKMNGKKKTDK